MCALCFGFLPPDSLFSICLHQTPALPAPKDHISAVMKKRILETALKIPNPSVAHADGTGLFSFPVPCVCPRAPPCAHPSLPAPVPLLGRKVKAAASPGSAVLTAPSVWLLGRFPFFFCWHRGGLRPAALPPRRQPSSPRNALDPLGISFQGKTLRSCLCGRYSRVSVSLLPFEVWCYLQASEAGSAFMLGAVPL